VKSSYIVDLRRFDILSRQKYQGKFMFGVGWKVAIALALASSGGWFYMDYRLTQEKLKVAKLETANVIFKDNADKLEDAATEQKLTMDTLIAQNGKAGERVFELSQALNNIQQEKSMTQRELEGLRQTEGVRVLENPFSRGEAAHERVSAALQSISGEKEGVE
jgi:hypothetical protein